MGAHVKILEGGRMPTYTVHCCYCKTKFEYNQLDVENAGMYKGEAACIIKCPLCGTQIAALGYSTDLKRTLE